MLIPSRIGVATLFVFGALTAGCSGSSTMMSSSTGYNAVTTPASDTQIAQGRAYRSKCDDLTNNFQRADCYRDEYNEEQDTSGNDRY